jgi:quercetin dioxygenase-like cupin family protein
MAATSSAPGDGRCPAERPRTAVLLGGAETGGRLAIVELILARGATAPRHRHDREDEALYVLAGELAVCIGEEWRGVPAGAAIFLPRGVEHGVAVVGARARALAVFTPAGFENFYRDLGAGAPDLERLVTIAARYDCEITGPPPTQLASARVCGPGATLRRGSDRRRGA